MPRGGKRRGTQGKQYSNRSDLRENSRPVPPMRVAGQTYGAQAEQVRSQQALPVRSQQAVPVATSPRPSSPGGVAGGSAPAPPAANLPPMDGPTLRPNEPLTTGIASGPGAGPEVLGPLADVAAEDPAIAELRAIYMQFPSEDLRELLEDFDTGRSF